MVNSHIFRTLAISALMTVAALASAQSVNINYGAQTSYDASELTDITLETNGSIIVHKTDGTNRTFQNAEVQSLDFSDTAADKVRKYMNNTPAQVVFNCVEVNDVNPLQSLNFRLKKADKQLFDAVILFSSNINFSKRENVVYIHNNDNVQALLNNYDHYIKPLKDRGIKVLLSLLGNHDGSGLANMSEARCRDFAQAIADTLQKYDLDGVFFDDEYSEYERDLGGQGFEGFQSRGSQTCASRLAYETKKAIGDRWVVTYRYGQFNSLGTVEGTKPGQYVDYMLNDYGVGGVWQSLQNYYPGSNKSQWGLYSVNVNGYTNWSNVSKVRTDGYGAFMVYGLNHVSSSFSYSYHDQLIKLAQRFFDDELEVIPNLYYKDWTPVPGLSVPNR